MRKAVPTWSLVQTWKEKKDLNFIVEWYGGAEQETYLAKIMVHYSPHENFKYLKLSARLKFKFFTSIYYENILLWNIIIYI